MTTTRFKRPRIRPALFFARFILWAFGFLAITSPWRTIYVHPEWRDSNWLIRHEIAHLAQMERDGWLKFWFRCLWWFVSPGYAQSPYEIEAMSVEHNPDHPLLAKWIKPRAD